MTLKQFIKKFTEDRRPLGINISSPDLAYYHKRAKLYFSILERLETEKDYSQVNALSYKRDVIEADFIKLRSLSQIKRE